MDENLMLFSKRIKMLRLEKEWSQDVLAEKLDCARSLISYYESGQREPVFTTILKLSKIFDVSPGYLMGETEFRNNSVKKTS